MSGSELLILIAKSSALCFTFCGDRCARGLSILENVKYVAFRKDVDELTRMLSWEIAGC